MTTRRTGVTFAILLAGALVLVVPGYASAHPLLLGQWGIDAPPAPTVYEFTPGEYVGNGMWRGEFTVTIAGTVISTGDYYLRVYSGPSAVIALRDGLRLSTRVGIIDLFAGTLDFMGFTYRRAGVVAPPVAPPLGPQGGATGGCGGAPRCPR